MSIFPPQTTRAAVIRTALRSGADTVFGAPGHFASLALASGRCGCPGCATPSPAATGWTPGCMPASPSATASASARPTAPPRLGSWQPTHRLVRSGSVGVPAPGVQVRLVEGELQVRMEASPYPSRRPPVCFLPDGAADGAGWFRTRDARNSTRSAAPCGFSTGSTRWRTGAG
ncbi:hypothetical protein GXW82_13075 [Streptacidiphilus sp. 4-A2]|nr:hypothetical protein [Streptacidiphilus sp. 4-A2]